METEVYKSRALQLLEELKKAVEEDDTGSTLDALSLMTIYLAGYLRAQPSFGRALASRAHRLELAGLTSLVSGKEQSN